VLMQIPISALQDRDTFNEIFGRVTDYTSPEMSYNTRTFKIASDFKAGVNWGGAHEQHNPQGMEDVNSHDDMLKLLNKWGIGNGKGTLGLAE
jgi:hypothetical protein